MSFMDKITGRPRDARADTAAFDSQYDDVVTAYPEAPARAREILGAAILGCPTFDDADVGISKAASTGSRALQSASPESRDALRADIYKQVLIHSV